MTKTMLTLAATAAIGLAAPAAAADFTFNFNSGGVRSGSSYGNSYVFTTTSAGQTLAVRVTGWNLSNSGSVTSAFVGQYDNGLGVINRNDGGSNYHAVDNNGSTDFLVFQFNQVVEADQIRAVAYRQTSRPADNDLTALFGDTTQPWTSSFSASQLSGLSNISFVGSHESAGSGSSSWRAINPLGFDGNMLVIAAGIDGGDHNPDGFKLKALTVSTFAAPVPEPATWAMMIAGFGMVGMGLRTRRSRTMETVCA